MLSYLFGGSKETKKVENADPELAMRDQMDEHGDFQTNDDGSLTLDSYLVFRAIILRQACRMFEPGKEKFQAAKFEAFVKKDQAAYVRIFREGQEVYNKCIMHMTKKAAEWIELSFENYQLTVQTHMADEKTRERVQKVDMDVRAAFEENKPVTQTKEALIEASKFKFQKDMEMFRKINSLKYTTSQNALQEIQMIEMSKTSDAILEKFGFDLTDLVKGSKHFDLDNNEQIASFRKLVIAQKESEEKAEFERAQSPQEVIMEMIKEGRVLGKPQFKSDGTMTFDYFLDTMKIVVKYTINQTREGLIQYQTERREAIKNKNEELYQKQILKCANWEQLTGSLLQANLYQALEVPKQVFEKSMNTYLMEPNKRTIYEEEMQKLRDELRTRKMQELTSEECIKSVKLLEEFKLAAQMKMYEIVRTQRLPPEMINAIIKVEKLRADDIFFNETGIEEEDVEPSIKRLNIDETEEYKMIIETYTERSKAFLEAKKEETAQFMQQVQEQVNAQQAQVDQVPQTVADD